ncbi:4-amino-4-deoxy-L-arabinose lipid A transferase [Desulfonema ishimotonii]|uniref:4-amino-4-deoxy-L-arabinose lipid A transferase n=1 Tax=Desulfonema ishimotonii TaxID=45657 RepID=A0A401FT03_9BACT|nr:phospholipid carrier-dependent glycosyltransferase [Desulfonema ishimotonii]GBC60086.1 4-amino-4-deoxy-L-arabinose lipid A transferase [Desulfonema ishimotonii]
MKMKKSAAAVIGLYILLYILPLGVRPLFIPDEVRYFEIPREMIASGDWVVPRINGIRYFEKPVMGYWLNAISMMIFGQNAFAVRFPSAVSAGISALAIFLMARKFAGGYAPAIFSATIFLTCIQVMGIGTFSVLDSPVSVFLTLTLVFFFFAYKARPGTPRKRRFLIISGICCGLAFLTKGFIAFAVPVLTVVPFMVWEGRIRELFRTVWLPLTAAILVSLPWGLMIHFRERDFWHYFFWVEHVNRFLSPTGGQHPQPFWFFIPVMLAGTLPWSALLPAAVRGLRDLNRSDAMYRFLLCWLIFPFLFFSASSGKLATYVLPCFPPLAILTAVGLLHYFQKEKNRAYIAGASVIGGLTGLVAIALAANQSTGFIGIRPYSPAETWKWGSALAGLGAWSMITLYSIRQKTVRAKLTGFAAAPLLFFFTAHFIIPEMTLNRKAPGHLIARNQRHISPDAIVVSDGDLIRAVCSFLKREDVYMFITPNELRYGLAYADSERRMLDAKQFRQLIARTPVTHDNHSLEKRPVVIIARAHKWKKYQHLFPKPGYADQYGKFVFMRF